MANPVHRSKITYHGDQAGIRSLGGILIAASEIKWILLTFAVFHRTKKTKRMKPICRLPFALVILLGMVCTPSVAYCQSMVFTVTPTTMPFPSTQIFVHYMFPTRVQLTLTNMPIADGHLGVSVPAGFKAYFDANAQYAWTDENFLRYDSNSTSTFTAAYYVQYTPTDTVGSHGTITNTISITLRNPPYTNTILTNTVTLTSSPSTLPQIKAFPYAYNWTNPNASAAQPDGRTYVLGDGYWRTFKRQYSPQWSVDATLGYAKTSYFNADDTLFAIVDATGLTFTGGETFGFVAWRYASGTNSGTMKIIAGSAVQTIQVSDMQDAAQPYALALPTELSNAVFAVLVVINCPKYIYVDNIQISGGALPIQLSSFVATSISWDAVELQWETLSETNNYGFIVQKFLNGVWQNVSPLIPGGGTTLQKRTYAYTDHAIDAGDPHPFTNARYRLCQIDLDGTKHCTEEVSPVTTGVDADVAYAFDLRQNFPNPFNPSTTIRYGLPHKTTVQLLVFNTLGQSVSTLVNGDMEAGYHEIKFDGSGLSSGVYFYRMQAGSYVETKKLLIVR